ncbi:hypothetical protein [Actinocrispum sp. NPDC049592]|uniref:hypothetical protein n=1 Tax=Actinocrispum sp. NPDC049592 TaxID=3154835 RepID=UPI00342D23BA
MDDLEEELTRLFQDRRLDVQVAADAEKTVVAGARRVRRNRIALVSAAGVVAAAVLATGTIVLTHGPSKSNQVADAPTLSVTSTSTDTTSPGTTPQVQTPSAATTPPASGRANAPTVMTSPRGPAASTSKPAVVPAVTATVLGPNGYGPFRLGMTAEQVVATGQVNQPAAPVPAGQCVTYTIGGQPGSRIVVSPRSGVVLIDPSIKVHTPEDVGEGTNIEIALSHYRDFDAQKSPSVVAVPGRTSAWYSISYDMDTSKVTGIILLGSQTEC